MKKLLFFLLLFPVLIFSQKKNKYLSQGVELMQSKSYNKAVDVLKKAEFKEKDITQKGEINYLIGMCYLSQIPVTPDLVLNEVFKNDSTLVMNQIDFKLLNNFFKKYEWYREFESEDSLQSEIINILEDHFSDGWGLSYYAETYFNRAQKLNFPIPEKDDKILKSNIELFNKGDKIVTDKSYYYPPFIKLFVEVSDSLNNYLSDVEILVTNNENGEVFSKGLTGIDGSIIFTNLELEKTYIISAVKENYKPRTSKLSTFDIESNIVFYTTFELNL